MPTTPAKKSACSGPREIAYPSPTRTPTPATITGSNRPLVTCGTWVDVSPDNTPKYSPTAADTGTGTGTKTRKSTDSAREKSRLRGKPRSTRKLPFV